MPPELSSCLLCHKTINFDEGINSGHNKSRRVKVLSKMFRNLCFVLQIKISINDWNFNEEQFPFCPSCCIHIAKLCKLYDQLKLIQEQINSVVAVLSATTIESKNFRGSNKGCQTTLNWDAKNYEISSHKSNKSDPISKMITRRFDAKVVLKDCQKERPHGTASGDCESLRNDLISYVVSHYPTNATAESIGAERVTRSTNITEINIGHVESKHFQSSNDKDDGVENFELPNCIGPGSPAIPACQNQRKNDSDGEILNLQNTIIEDTLSENRRNKTSTSNTELNLDYLERNEGVDLPDDGFDPPNSPITSDDGETTRMTHNLSPLKAPTDDNTESRSDQQSNSKLAKISDATASSLPVTGNFTVISRAKSFHPKTRIPGSTLTRNGSTYEYRGIQMVVIKGELECLQCDYKVKTGYCRLKQKIKLHISNVHTAYDGDIILPYGASRTFMMDGFKFTETEGGYECGTCGKFCSSKRAKWTRIRHHIRVAHLANDRDTVLVDEASRTFMLRGLKFSEVEGGHSCGTCGKFLASPNGKWKNIRQHLLTIHLGAAGGMCTFCGEYKKLLTVHIAQRHLEEKCICDICGKEFKNKTCLRTHQKIHQIIKTEPKIQCDRCGKKFSNKSILRIHTRIHTGEKPYKCDTCGKQFTHESVFKTHVASVHAEIRPFACDQCHWTFGVKFLLTRHIKQVHQGIKPPPPKKRKVVADESVSTSSESDENEG